MAPEILDNTGMYGRRKLFTEKSDVYSFAMVLHEVHVLLWAEGPLPCPP